MRSFEQPLTALAFVGALMTGAALTPRGELRPATNPLACRELAPLEALDAPTPREVTKGEVLCFTGTLAAGEVLDLRARQLGVDLVLHAFGPGGERLLRVDHPIGGRGVEPLALAPASAARVLIKVEVASVREAPRSLALELRTLGPGSPEQIRLAGAVAALAEAEELRRTKQPESSQRALALYPEAEATFNAAGEIELARRAVRQAIPTALQLGALFFDNSHLSGAESAYGRALTDARRAGEVGRAADAENGLGITWAAQGRLREAEAAYGRALALYQAAGSALDVARVRANLGTLFLESGAAGEALDLYHQALAGLPPEVSARERADFERKVGWALVALGRLPEAERLFTEALERSDGESGPLGFAHAGLGRVRYEAGDLAAAEASFDQAAALFAAAGEAQHEAVARQNAAWCRLRCEGPEEALSLFAAALAPARASAQLRLEAAIEAGIAFAHRAAGRPDAAYEHARRALDLVEDLRAGSDRLDLRRALLAGRLDLHDLAVELAQTLETEEPGKGHLEEGFAFSERSKARSLLDALSLPARAVPERRELEEGVNQARGKHEIDRALAALRAAERVEGMVRAAPLSLAEVRRALLDAETLLLAFDLGAEQSRLWVISLDEIRTFQLPPRQTIEDQARRVARLLATGEESDPLTAPSVVALARTLLGEAAPFLEARRWWIVPDGSLWALPFDALPDPRSGAPLLAGHEITLAPSASIAARLGERERLRPPAPHRLALLADPAFAPGEARLAASAREAAVLMELVPEAERSVALGREATKAWVLGGALRGRQLLHFATHGRLDPVHPELSGLDLAAPAAGGEPRDAFLAAHEIAALELSADLAVLSACETALGAPVQGEGLVGLPQAFLRAGASRVIVSLWQVRDRAAAELMARFYRLLLVERLPAAAALHRAKLSLAQEPAFAKPRDWAAFVLQGAR